MPKSRRIFFVGNMALAHNRSAIIGLADYASANSGISFGFSPHLEFAHIASLKMKKGSADGIILSDIHRSWPADAWTENQQIPLVDMSIDKRATIWPQITIQEASFGQLAANYFIDRGFHKLKYAGPSDLESSKARWNGFKNAASLRGVNAERLDVLDPYCVNPLAQQDHKVWLKKLQQNTSQKTAIFAYDDELASVILKACLEAKIPIPGQVAILGTGNDNLYTQLLIPHLSSITINSREMAYKAMKTLDNLLCRKKVDSQLCVGQATGVITRLSTDVFGIDDDMVRNALSLIHKRTRDGLSVKWLASELAVSRITLERRFASALGSSPAAEISRAQAELARRLLTDADKPVEQIAVEAGYSSARQLRISLRDHYGKSPRELRGYTGKYPAVTLSD